MSIKSCLKHLHAAERGERACDSIKKARKKNTFGAFNKTSLKLFLKVAFITTSVTPVTKILSLFLPRSH